MKSTILEALINLARNQAVAMVICFLMGMEALCTSPTFRIWRGIGANMTHVFGGKFTEVTVTSIIVCAAIASANPTANLACYLSSRCVFASVYQPRVEGGQTEGFRCWYSVVCMYRETLLEEYETVPEPTCPEFLNLQCTKNGMILQDTAAPPPSTTCTAPFEQHSFGCMYDSDFKGTYCEALLSCHELGANLSSPATEEDTADMRAFYNTKYAQQNMRHFVGLFKMNGVWRWPSDLREAPPAGTGAWAAEEPNGIVNFAVMYPYSANPREYRLGDGLTTSVGNPICHVWPVV